MKKILLTATLLTMFPMNTHPQLVAWINQSILHRAGCACTTQEERDDFVSRLGRRVANILHKEYNANTGWVVRNSHDFQGIMSAGILFDMSDLYGAIKTYDYPVILTGYPAF